MPSSSYYKIKNMLIFFSYFILFILGSTQSDMRRFTCCRVQLKCDGTQWRTGGGGGKWRGNWWMEWVASTLHTTSEHGVSNITTADAHTLAASSRLNWHPRWFIWPKDEIWFLRVYHHISNAVYIDEIPLHHVRMRQMFVWVLHTECKQPTTDLYSEPLTIISL